MDEVGLGKQLQSIRTKAGLTQQALCQLANISYSTLAKIERGAIKSPSIFTIQSIAEALGVSMDQLLGLQSTSTGMPPIVPKKLANLAYALYILTLMVAWCGFFTKLLVN